MWVHVFLILLGIFSLYQIEMEIFLCAVDTPTEVLDIILTLIKKLRKIVFTTQFTQKFGSSFTPSGVAVCHNGRFFVSDSRNHKIDIFSKDGEFISTFGKKGTEIGQFISPQGLVV